MRIRVLPVVVTTAAVVVTMSSFGAGLTPASATGDATSYLVVFKDGQTSAGIDAVHTSGGQVSTLSKVGVATVVSSNATFGEQLQASGTVDGVAQNAGFSQPATPAAAPPPGTRTVAAEAAACASLYSVPVTTGPDPLGPCQWDMRIIGASPSGSYAVNQGAGVKIGDLDTGIDLDHPDLAGNLDVAESCSFIYASTPTSDPSEQVTPGDCSNKAAVQDLNGHGTHTAGIAAAAI